jgi:methylenetetrahydrofolate dehydrogenase (NADP+)/methenyltetrahydrofolate cyclohydrolase
MKIDGKEISENILNFLKIEVAKLKKKPHLAVFLIDPTPENDSFVKAKMLAVKRIGGDFTLVTFPKTPDFMTFALKLKEIAFDSNITGIVIQKPLPSSLNTESLFDYIPLAKEIEGHKRKTIFSPPLGLAILTVLKAILKPGSKEAVKDMIVDEKKDLNFFKRILKRKKVVLIGRGETGGKIISKFFNELKINFINTHSKTPEAGLFFKDADILISAVGKKIVLPEHVKPGAILINVGIHKEDDKWKGDYDEKEIKDIAGFYTPTPGGLGPLDVSYLMWNLVQTTKKQK